MDAPQELAEVIRRLVAEEVARQLSDLRLGASVERVDEPKYLTIAQAAKRANRHPTTIERACASGELFATQRSRGGRWSIRPASPDAWLDGTPDPHHEEVERWKDGPKTPPAQRPRRRRPPAPTPPGDDAA